MRAVAILLTCFVVVLSCSLAVGDQHLPASRAAKAIASSKMNEPVPAGTIFGPWKVGKPLGRGEFGFVQEVEPAVPGSLASFVPPGVHPSKAFAIKLCYAIGTGADKLAKTSASRQGVTVFREYTLYQSVFAHPGNKHIIKVPMGNATGEALGPDPKKPGQKIMYRWLTMPRLGASLKDRMEGASTPLSWPTAAAIAVQILDALQYVHSKGYVFIDINPGNIMMGHPDSKDKNVAFLADFGLAEKTKDIMGTPAKATPNGAPLFVSSAYLLEWPSTGRDDLEAFAYLLVDLCCSRAALPWSSGTSAPAMEALKKEWLSIGKGSTGPDAAKVIKYVQEHAVHISKPHLNTLCEFIKRVLTLKPKDKIPYADLSALLAKDAVDLSKPSAELVWPSHGPVSGVKPKGKRGRRSTVSPPHAGAGDSAIVIDLEADSGAEGVGKGRRGGKAPRRSGPTTPHAPHEGGEVISLTESHDVTNATAAAADVAGAGKRTSGVGTKRGRNAAIKATPSTPQATATATTSDTEGSGAGGKGSGAKPRRKRGGKITVETTDTETEAASAPRGKRARTSINDSATGGSAPTTNTSTKGSATKPESGEEERGEESEGPVAAPRKRQPMNKGIGAGKASKSTPKGKGKADESEDVVINVNSGTESDAPKAKRPRRLAPRAAPVKSTPSVSTAAPSAPEEAEEGQEGDNTVNTKADTQVKRSKQLPVKRRPAARTTIESETESDESESESDVPVAAPRNKQPRGSNKTVGEKASPAKKAASATKATPTRTRRSLSSEPESGFTTEAESEPSGRKAQKAATPVPVTPSTAAPTPASSRAAPRSSLTAAREVEEAITLVAGTKRGRQQKASTPPEESEEESPSPVKAAPVPAKRAVKKQAPREKQEAKKEETGKIPSRPAGAPRTLVKPTPMSRMPATPASNVKGAGAAPRMTFSATKRPASPARTLGQLADGKDVHPDKDKHKAAIRHSLEKPVRSEEQGEEYEGEEEEDLSALLPYDSRADHSRLSAEGDNSPAKGGLTNAMYAFGNAMLSVLPTG